MTVYHGKFYAPKKKFGIVVSRFNEYITGRLLEGALVALKKAGVPEKNIRVVWVPGGLEVPFFCKKLKTQTDCDAVIALSCVIRGGTYHFECVSNELTRGIDQVALESGTPIACGVITADNLEQAIDRAGLKSGNKGEQAALAALEIASLDEQLSGKKKKQKTSRRKR
ncbi:MAG TPA: 6,7-dimethyl-8-ribityllumazine synthase [Candidatus Omnitrophota bacterium]|nr:6,7-dimethyl-8-ribityllumazine synthase [Candidatus Omnitrophota bacterium]HPS36481.1 6,7-dimethyl-8-ribityllumazine synthase [Candidatus Omnitrophota bacterium]